MPAPPRPAKQSSLVLALPALLLLGHLSPPRPLGVNPTLTDKVNVPLTAVNSPLTPRDQANLHRWLDERLPSRYGTRWRPTSPPMTLWTRCRPPASSRRPPRRSSWPRWPSCDTRAAPGCRSAPFTAPPRGAQQRFRASLPHK